MWYGSHRRRLLDRAFCATAEDRQEEKRLQQELAAINKELGAMQKEVKTRFGLEDQKVRHSVCVCMSVCMFVL